MESRSKIVSVNVSTEPSCELAASSSQNSLPGSSFMEVNARMNGTSTEPTCELAANSSQNSLPGSSFMEVNDDMNSTSTEPTYKLAASSSQNLLPGCSSLVCLVKKTFQVRCSPERA